MNVSQNLKIFMGSKYGLSTSIMDLPVCNPIILYLRQK